MREEIVRLALSQFPGSREIAVRNFLGSMMGTSRPNDEGNLLLDANLYKWDPQTIGAIAFGIETFYLSLN